MNTYKITSLSGDIMGEYRADSAPEAVVQMHREAGYHCSYDEESDEIVFLNNCNLGADGQDICGQKCDWEVELASADADGTTDTVGSVVEYMRSTGRDIERSDLE